MPFLISLPMSPHIFPDCFHVGVGPEPEFPAFLNVSDILESVPLGPWNQGTGRFNRDNLLIDEKLFERISALLSRNILDIFVFAR